MKLADYKSLTDLERNALVHIHIFGLPVPRWWSIHSARHWPEAGVEWKHTVSSIWAQQEGLNCPGEIMLPDNAGDMPILLPGPKPYTTCEKYIQEIINAVQGNVIIYYMPEGSRFEPNVPDLWGVALRAYEDDVELCFDAEFVWGPTLPYTICLAALIAKGVIC